MTDLRVVKQGDTLVWPREFERRVRFRGGEGYIVDLDGPLERDLLCKGQGRKLRPVSDGEPDPIIDPFVIEKILDATGISLPRVPKRNVTESLEENDDAADEFDPLTSDLALDELRPEENIPRPSTVRAELGLNGEIIQRAKLTPEKQPEPARQPAKKQPEPVEESEPLELAKPELD
ncbi:MAG TPA: hypothetical protein VM537_22690 [Anaerolineae bacterium]|nr:hypothetical protein [Anaerolineae bacterium]